MVRSLSENHLRNNLLGLYFGIVDRYGTIDTAEATTAEASMAKAKEATKRGEDFICNNIDRYCLPPLFY
jgi:hypothetical protein